jgi:hypothetical protein
MGTPVTVSMKAERIVDMASEGKRTATIHLNSKDSPTMVRVQLPHKITPGELSTLINDSIVRDIVARHTGCTCLSGTINVLIESVFQEAIHVDLSKAPGR